MYRFNVFYIAWPVIFPDDGGVIAETCCSVVFTVCSYVDFVNKTHCHCMT